MANLAADINIDTFGPVTEVPFSANAAATYYRGAIAFVDTAGGVQVGTQGIGDRPIGVVLRQQVIAAIADQVEVCIAGVVAFPVSSQLAAADEGNIVFFDSSGTLTDNIDDAIFDSTDQEAPAANDCIVGKLLRVTSTQMFIQFGSITGQRLDATTTLGLWY